MDENQIVIIGAGISGCVLAEKYATLNKKVHIIEKRDHIGGNCYDYIDQYGVLIHKYGPHFFHTNHQEVWDYVNRFTDWFPYEHRVLSQVDNLLVPIPVNINTINLLFKTNIKTKPQMLSWLKKEVIKIKKPINSEESVLSRLGVRLYDKMFKNYTIKQWGIDPKKLDFSVMDRIPIHTSFDDRYFTDKYQAMPKKGYTNLFKNILNHKNIKLSLNTDYFQIKSRLKFNKLFFTGSIDEFFNYKYGKLQYRSLQFRYKNLKMRFFQPRAQINYPNDFKFTRITEIKHATGQKINSTTIVYEYPTWKGDPYYPMLTEINKEIYLEYEQIARKLKKEHIYFAGRLANYKYFNMDQAFKNALDLFNELN